MVSSKLLCWAVCLAVAIALTDAGHIQIPWKGKCITSCDGLPDGDYQSCLGCTVYASCGGGIFYDNRPCAPAHPPTELVWDDNLKRCEYVSTTCPGHIHHHPPPHNPACWLPLNHGHSHCYHKLWRYYYNHRTGKCIKFWYSGCGGNGNNFFSDWQCHQVCDPRPHY